VLEYVVKLDSFERRDMYMNCTVDVDDRRVVDGFAAYVDI
jgi:hypothetical protein